MYTTGEKKHSKQVYSFEVTNPVFTGEVTSEHGGLELIFSMENRRSRAAKMSIRDKEFSLAAASSVLAFNPQEQHRELLHEKDQSFEAIVFLEEALKHTLGNNFDSKNYVFDQTQSTDSTFAANIKSLYSVLRNNRLDDWTIGGLSEGYITYIFSHFAKSQRMGNDSIAPMLATYLSTRFQDQNCWLGDAETEFGVTRFHLIRAFKSRYQKTPHRFLTELRINYAAEQLRAGKFKIIDIAHMSGFADLSTFNKCFKRHFKMSPREFSNCSPIRNSP